MHVLQSVEGGPNRGGDAVQSRNPQPTELTGSGHGRARAPSGSSGARSPASGMALAAPGETWVTVRRPKRAARSASESRAGKRSGSGP